MSYAPLLLFSLSCLTASSVPTYSELPKKNPRNIPFASSRSYTGGGIHFPAVPEKEEGEDGREETAMSTTSRKRSASAPEYAKFVTGSDAFGKRKEEKKGILSGRVLSFQVPFSLHRSGGAPPHKICLHKRLLGANCQMVRKGKGKSRKTLVLKKGSEEG